MNFEFATANRILFGSGTLARAGEAAAGFGRRILVVTGKSTRRAERLLDVLRASRLDVVVFPVDGEPDVQQIEAGVDFAKAQAVDVVTGFGGGSALDAAKAIAALATNPGGITDYLEVVGKGQAILIRPLPMIAVPTTAGTGTEVTRNAVISVGEHAVKVSMRSELMLPQLAIVDPELTLGLPPAVTAATGMDALTQLIEPYVSTGANPFTDAVCRDGIVRASRSLLPAWSDGNNLSCREDMSLAATFGGIALANARLGAVHGMAGPIGGMFNAPHGAVCGRLLPEVVRGNIEALEGSLPGSPALSRYGEAARWMTGDPASTALDGAAWLDRLCRDLQLPGLGSYGITRGDFPAIIEKSMRASSMKGNPVQLSSGQLEQILERAL